MYSNSPVSLSKFKEMNMITLMKSSLRVLLVFLVLMYSKDAISQTISYSPAPVGGTITMCEGGILTVTVNGTVSGEVYTLNANPPSSPETLTATGTSLTFTPVTYTTAANYSVNVVRTVPSVWFSLNQPITIVADPTAPTLTLSQPEGSVNAGPMISATLNTAGSGGVSGSVDSYEYSIDGGTSWLAYNLGDNISTTSYMMPSVKIKALRSHPNGLGCLAETIYTWPVISRVHDNTGATGSYYDIQQAIDAANTASGDVLEIDAVTIAQSSVVNVNKSLTIQGKGIGLTTVELSSTWFNTAGAYAFTLNAPNITIQDIYFKIVGKGQGDILGILNSNTNISNNRFSGEYVVGDGEVTRAATWSASNLTGLIFDNNIIESLRQPGYINNGTGTISNNTITNTRGWVIAGTGTMAMTGNKFNSNTSHITILTGSNIAGLTINNNDLSGAVTDWAIDNRVATTLNATCNWWGSTDAFDVQAAVSGDVQFLPYSTVASPTNCLGYGPVVVYEGPGHTVVRSSQMTIQEGVDAAVAGDKIAVAAGTYNERVTLSKQLTIDGAGSGLTILNGTGLAGTGSGITLNTGITNVTIKDLSVKNYAGVNPNSSAGIYAVGGNNNLIIKDVDLADNIGGSGFYANGPIDNVLLDNVDAHGHTNVNGAARGIVIWNGHKSNITITNCEVYNNNCCGIELQDGSASGVNITNNNIHDNWDSGIGLTGLDGTTASNLVDANTLTNNGRFGIEIKNPNGNGTNTVISNNNVTQNASFVSLRPSEVRDIAGIAVFRRGLTGSNADVPNGVKVITNNVTGYIQDNGASSSEGFGIVIEGTNHTATGNTLTGNDVGLQQQSGHTPYPGDGNQNDLADNYFGRGNSPLTCSNIVTPNTYVSNGIDTRNVNVGGGLVTNTTTLKTFCSIQAAIDNAGTLNGHTLSVAVGTYNEYVVVTKSLTIQGDTGGNSILAGSGTGSGLTIAANNVTIKDLKIQNYVEGIRFNSTQSNIALQNLVVTGNSLYGINFNNFTISNLTLSGSELSSSSTGIKVGSAASIDGLNINNSVIKNNVEGLSVANSSTGIDAFNHVTITNTTFENNSRKGIYTEKLSNATFDGITVNNCGIDPTYGSNSGIDLNLKYDDFENITIKNSTITNSGATGSSSYPGGRPAISVSVRDDAPSYNSNPATLDGFTFLNNTVSVPNHMLAFESVAGPSNAVLNNNDLSAIVSGKYAVINTGQSDINLTCNWHGTVNYNTIQSQLIATGTGDINLNTYSTDNTFTSCIGRVHNVTINTYYGTIQEAIDAVTTLDGHIISAAAGIYEENVLVNKQLEIYGAGQGLTTIVPSFVGATPPSCTGSDCAGASNVIKLAANNIHLHDFSIDGNNPALTSGVVVGGVDIDARNGIIGDGTSGRSNIELNNITISNIYLRGIYPQYTTSMSVHNNTVSNVRGSGSSIAIFSWASSGTVSNNTVSDANDAIAANHSLGITFSNNNVSNSDSGIHSDNNGDGSPSTADIITGNTVINGSGAGSYGIWVFVPYLNTIISDNTITNLNAGLAAFGALGSTPTVTMSGNTVNGMSLANSYGAYFTTETGFGSGINDIIFTNNFITGTSQLMELEAASGFSNNLVAHNNSFIGNTIGIVKTGSGTFTEDLSCNWWGSASAASVMAAVGAGTNYTPWLSSGGDSDAGPGFTPTGTCDGSTVVISSATPTDMHCGDPSGSINVIWSGGTANYTVDWGGVPATGISGTSYNITGLAANTYTITVTDANGSTATVGPVIIQYLPVTNTTGPIYYATIQAAINASVTGDVINVCAGTYKENLFINKGISLIGAGRNVTIVTAASNAPTLKIKGNDAPVMTGNVLIEGLSFTDNDTKFHKYIVTTDHIPSTSTLTFQNNRITNGDAYGFWGYHDHGTLMFANNVVSDVSYGMLLEGWDTAPVTVDNNEFTNLHLFRTNGVAGSSTPVGLLAMTYSGSGGVDCNNPYVISNNKLYGYAVNGSGILFYGGLAGAVKQYTNVEIATNEIAVGNNGIMLLNYSNTGNDPLGGVVNASIHNNKVDGNNIGLNLLGFNPGTTAHQNSIAGSVTYSIQNTGTGAGADVDATCNWFGSANSNVILTKISGLVNYSPYLINGNETDPATGFQPTGACSGSPVVISSAVASPATCAGLGQIVVTWTGGVSPYGIAWSGPSSGSALGVTSPYTIPSLAVGSYSITVTDASLSSATISATVISHPVTNTSLMTTYANIQDAINAAAPGNVIEVCSGTYNEQVLVNKSLTIKGVGATRPIVDFTGTVTGKPTLFDVSADGVTIDNIHFQVDLAALRSAIIASSPGLDLITIKNSLIDPYGTPAGPYGERNAVSINYGTYRVATGGVNQINFQNNTVTSANPVFFRSAISTDESGGTFTGNNLTGLNQDIQVRFANNGNVSITSNTFNQGGVEIGDPNAGAGIIDISNNTFSVANGATYNNALRLKNNYTARTTTVTGNTFTGHEWGISLENYQTVTIDNNTFTPIAASTTYRHITINTKEFSSTSGYYPPVIGAIITKNTFNGSGAAGGFGLAFYNHDNDSPVFNAFTLGTSGNENIFDGTIGTYIYLDGQSGPTGAPVTTMAPWAVDLDAQNNTFAGVSPAAMTLTQLFALEDKIVHKIDNSVLGFVLVKPGHDFVTVNSFIAPATTQASVQRGVDAAASGFTVNVAAGTYDEVNVKINKPLTLLGAQANVACGSRGAESIIQDLTNSALPVYTVNSDDVTINGFEVIDPWANSGIDAGASGPSNLNIKFNNIHNIGTLRGSGNVYAVRYLVGSSTTSNINISDNCIDNISNTTTALGHAGGIWFGQSTSNDTVNNLTIERNTISNVKSALSNKSTWGIVIGTGSNPLYTGSVVSPVISSNSITNLIGASYAHAIGLEGNTPGAMVTNNFIDNITITFIPAAAEGVNISSNSGSSTVTIHDNSFTNVSYGIGNSTGNTVNATCNWYGSSNANVVMTKIYGLVTYSPYLINGTDNAPSTIGFQPVSGACLGSPIVISSAVASPVTCAGTGKIVVTWTGGISPYDIAWSGPSSGSALGVTSPYTIPSLAAGSYSITVTDANSSTATASPVIIQYLPVTNTAGPTYYATIQAAINAANNGDVIEVCAGTYTEDLIVNKSLVIKGANVGISAGYTPGVRGSESIIVGEAVVSATGVTFDGFQFNHPGGSNKRLVYLSTAGNTLNIQNNIFDLMSTISNAISTNDQGSTILNVTNNKFMNQLYNSSMYQSRTVYAKDALCTISGNDFINNNQNLYLIGTTTNSSVVSGNRFTTAGIAILTGAISGVSVTNNDFVSGGGIYSDATSNLMVTNNSFASGVTYAAWFSSTIGAGNVVNNNSLLSQYTSGPNAGKTLFNFSSQMVDATCNWYGSSVAAAVAAKISGNFTYSPWLVTAGTLNSPGFTPDLGSCGGTPVVINSLVATNQTCAVPGTITVNFSGGTTPYKMDWTGGTQVTGIVGSPYVINGLSAGNYTVTVTDNYGSTATSSVAVIGLPVENITTPGFYPTIQSAINAATAGDVIKVCAGTYNEEVVINKAITLNGAQQGVDPRPSASSARTIGGLNESIIVALKNKKVIDIQANAVIIDGFQITQSGGSGTSDAVKASTLQSNIEFKNNIVANSTDEGIQLEAGNNNSIHNNYIFNPIGDGITLSSYDVAPLKGSNQKIWNNDISGSTSGYGSIYLYGTQNVEVYGNIINTLSSGISIGSGGLPVSNANVHNNEINTELRTAYSAYALGISIDDSGDNIMIHNNKVVQVGTYSPPANKDRYNLIRVGVANTSNPTNVSINENYMSRVDNENYIYVIASVTNRVDAECNWYSTASAAQVAARIGGTGAIRYSPFLTNGTDSDMGAVGFTPVAGSCSCPSGNLVTNITTGELFCGIQEAIDDVNTLNGDVIIVGPGTYAEDIVVSKELTINGPNAAIGGCVGGRAPEAIIVPATNAIATGEMIKVMASNVTITGFTIDGDNPAINSGFLGTNGADINAAEGITTYTDNRNNLTVTNNIFKNLSYFAVSLNGASGSSPATSGNVISNNKFTDLGTYAPLSGIANWGGGVLLYNNQYAAVTNNCMTNVRLGIQTGNFSRANPGTTASQMITGNIIQARKLGIFHNLFYSVSSPYTLSNNTITGLANVNETTNWIGMNLTSLSQSIHTASNNNVDGSAISLPKVGISVWNDLTAPSISGGTITGVEIGINVNNFEGYPSAGSDAGNTVATISGTTITNASIAGIRVNDNPSNTNGATVTATIGNSNTITGSPVGVLVTGSDATATIMGNAFTGNQVDIQVAANTGLVTASPNNNLSGTTYGIQNLSTTVVNGTLNYWGSAFGPGPIGSGTGVNVTTLVNFCPWLNAPAPGGTAVYAVPGTISVTETGGPTDNDGSVCSGETVTLAVTGATAASTYLWSTTATTASIVVNPTTTTTYSVTVSYGGCSNVLNTTIIVYPVPVVSLVSLQNVKCYGGNTGEIEVVGTVGPSPYTYFWNNAAVTPKITGLIMGTYSVTVEDFNQCSASASYTITQPTLLKIDNFVVTNETCQPCNDGTITVNASGGTPAYMYSNNGGTSFQSSNYFDNLMAGTYYMVVKDANGCQTAPEQVIITENGVYPDLTPSSIISSAQFTTGDSSNQVVFIRNVGSGATTAPIVFRVTKFVPTTGLHVRENLDPSVIILGDPYTLNNNQFDMVDEGGLLRFTSKASVVIPAGGTLRVGLVVKRTGGGKGTLSSSVNIVAGTGGGEINPLNNQLSFYITKL